MQNFQTQIFKKTVINILFMAKKIIILFRGNKPQTFLFLNAQSIWTPINAVINFKYFAYKIKDVQRV